MIDSRLTNEEKADAERDSMVFKADAMIQKAQFSLTVSEQRFLLYAISKIKPDDDYNTRYYVKIKDFQRVCGTDSNDSYHYVMETVDKISKKLWWLEDESAPVNRFGRRKRTQYGWITSIHLDSDPGMVDFKFHEDIFPYLFRLSERMRENGGFYTGYTLRYILPMKSAYSIRMYELLKSYHKNNESWWFKIDTIRRLLDCENYERFPDFRRFVLEPAVREINQYTDIKVEYSLIKEGRKVVAVDFTLLDKAFPEILQAHHDGLTEIEGNVHYWDINKDK